MLAVYLNYWQLWKKSEPSYFHWTSTPFTNFIWTRSATCSNTLTSTLKWTHLKRFTLNVINRLYWKFSLFFNVFLFLKICKLIESSKTDMTNGGSLSVISEAYLSEWIVNNRILSLAVEGNKIKPKIDIDFFGLLEN